MKNKRVLVGMSWPYANGRLHIGHIASSLPGDVIARYWRDNGAEVSFVSGADCFGTPILVYAKQNNMTPEKVAETFYKFQCDDYNSLMFSFDNYTKTMSPHHMEFSKNFHGEMYDSKAGNTFVKEVKQLYCPACKQYLPDRYVEGVCPYCGKPAKGDSCDHCGKILEPEDLKDPKCKLCGGTPEMRDTKQIYLRLSNLEKQIQKNAADKGMQWTNNAVAMTNKYLNEGLIDRAITRNISWGVDLPDSAKKLLGDLTDKKIYIWAENVLGYLSATKEIKSNWQEFLYDDTNTEKIHYYVHAKDNIPFHSVILPGLMLANSAHEWHLPDRIIASEYITLNSKKMSKSEDNYITARELIDEYDVDYIRYYFLRNVNDKKDANFTYDEFINTINGELIDNFGNLVNRTLTFVKNKFENIIPNTAPNKNVSEQIAITNAEVSKYIEAGVCNKALAQIMELVAFGNKWFNDNAPWKTLDKQIIADCVAIIRTSCNLLKYFVPKSTDKVLSWIKGEKLGNIEVLFKKLERRI